jgi:hypothetical protein
MIRFLLTLFALAALVPSVVASTVITGTLTITNAANINSTNAYTIDVNGDVRTWTNGVVTPSTDILASTNTATAALRALVHFATYPVSSLVLSGDGTSYLSWRAETDAALAITLNTNTWGVVTYATNTVGVTATTVAVPYTFFGASSQNAISDGLINWLNLAPTNKISSRKVTWPLSAQTADSAVTNWVADFAGNPYRSITASTNVNFIQSTNRPTAATNVLEAVYFITASGANRTLTLNSSWLPTPSAITITNGTIGILSVAGRGTAEGDVHWSYSLGGYVRDTDTDTDDQTAAEVVSTPAGTLAATDVQAALDELDTEKEPALTDSASLRGTLSDESGTGAAVFAGGDIAAGTATTAAANDNDTSVATTAFVQTELTDLIDGGAGWVGVQDFGGASDLEVPNGAAPTVNTFGEIAADNDLWGAGRGALVHYDGTATTALVAPLVSDTPSNGQVPKWNTGGTITWEDDSTGAPGSGDDVFINGGAITHPDFDDSALDIIWTIVDSTNAVPSFARAAAIGSDPALSANHATIGTTGIVFEGATADTSETLLTATDPTGDRTLTLPDATDTLVGKATTDVFTNKTLDAAGTGNVLKQTLYREFQRPDYGDGVGAIPQTNSYTVSGLMHYTFSGSAETNANWVVYETTVPVNVDTSVEWTATFGFVSGGTDADDVTWHLTYALGAAGAALPTGTGIATSPIVATVTPTTAASGDVQYTAAVTLTGWAASMTAGTPLFIRVARLNNSNDDTARDLYLRIAYGSTQ